MLIQEIDNKTIWEGFLDDVAQKTFLQSWSWGEFNRAMGEKIWRLGVYDDQELAALALVVKVSARRGNFLFIPHGPVMRNLEIETGNERFEIMDALRGELKNIARQENCSFVRISPMLEDSEENRMLLGQLGFVSAPMHMHAELTWLLDISPGEDELLQGMRKTTRNLVRRGERDGVQVTKGRLDEFYPLFEETVARQGFVGFSNKYLSQELISFNQEEETSAQIFLAKKEGKILAGALVVFYDDTMYYHHGASLHSSVPAAYSLQWEIIKEARRRKTKYYNFWGVVPESDTKHPWWGLSLFKRGFGGREWNLMHAQDLPLSWKYYLSWTIERVRKWRRGY